jgi:amino acid adenylation domain-containing protein
MTHSTGSEHDTAQGRCLHHLFETQAERTPDATAVVFGDEELTYRELNRRANRLAHRLQESGVRPEALLGIYVERSVEMVVGLLGTLKAGGAYIPLDPTYPRERLAFMLADARVPVLLTQRRLLESLPTHQAQVLCLDTDGEVLGPESEANPTATVTGENLAYVTYTSGSTGKPKGVQISHHAVVNCLRSMRRQPGLTDQDTLLAVTTLAFDMSVLEVFLPLTVGARVVLVSREATVDGARLIESLTRSNATFTQATPATWRLLLDAGWDGNPSLKILSGGEALPRKLAARLVARGASLWNFYGPTETTIFSAGGQVVLGEGPISIGRPIAHTQLYILDSQLEPVPAGSMGELHIGGAGLARGYLNRPGLTAEKFVPHPFSSEPGARLYQSGDLARYCPDGTIELLGRIDHQIKLRGFRIELGEVEAVLEQHPVVREAVVVAQDDALGDKQLVAYVIPDRKQEVAAGALRDFLRTRLPEYMVPGTFVLLDALPLSPNGKLDRHALPAPDRARPELESPPLAPRSPTEEVVAGIWTEVLGLEGIGVSDNFFDLGGHSLKATQVVSRVRDAFQVELPVHSVFASPTVAGLAKVIEQVGRKRVSSQAPPIQPVPRRGGLPLSFSQERAWFIQHLNPTNIAYHFQATVRFTGPLDPAVLGQSLSEIVRRHEIVRTTFPAVDGRPTQLIHQAFPVRLPVIDLQSSSEERREAEAQRLIDEEVQRPFDLTRLPLVRWTLLRLRTREWLLVHVEHHLIHDGWSFRVFLREVLELYKAFSAGRPSPLPQLPIQFADFAVYQRRWMQGQEAAQQLAYWKRKLGGTLPVLALPTDRLRPAVQSFRGAAPRMELPLPLCESLRVLSRRENATLFMTLLSVYAVLLHRYSGQDEVCVGSGVANRRRREAEGLLGMLVNNVVLRLDLSGNPSFRAVLGRVREVALQAYAHEDLPFDQVVQALQPKRDPSRNPLFQAMFNFHDAPLADVELPGLTLTLTEALSNGSAKFDLNIIVIPRSEQRVGRPEAAAEGITMIWEYNSDLFDAATIARMMEHYQRLLEGVVADPARPQSALPLSTEAERRQLVVEWNETTTAYPRDSTVHQVVAAQAARTPDALAVICPDKRLSYRALNRQANQLAHYLRKQGVGPDVLVGVCVERSPEMVIALLGILKAGGAYLPLDPAYPAERLAFMLQDTQAPVLLTQRHLLERLPVHGARVVCPDTDWAAIAQESETDPVGGATAEHLAYVMYTSGSTGQPKGVEIRHRGIVRLVCGAAYAKFDTGETFLQLAPIAFDASTFELWGALAHGARCVIFPGTMPAPQELGAVLQRERVSTLWLTASLFNTVIDEAPEALSGVRQLLIGGEALSVPHVRWALDRLPATQIINGYGPTESTTFTCCYPIPRHLPPAVSSIPLGRPIANTEVLVLDPYLQPVPIGVPGELYVGGDGLARGYHKRPELTAEKFIPHPFRADPGARLYRTGDLVRYLADGNLEFLGRIDQQVKLWGFRIELGEIEAALTKHPAVREAVVVMEEETSGDKRLVAYFVPRQEPSPSIGELRSLLGAKLPEYMVPAAFVPLGALPLLPSGKLNRRALPSPERVRPELENEFVAPRSPVEARLAEIWTSLLGIEPVGVYDDFFALGGHSLLATQVMSRLRTTFRLDLPLLTIFEAPTIAGLGLALTRRQEEERAGMGRVSAEVKSLSDVARRRRLSDEKHPG